MILIDRRQGSAELLGYLDRRNSGIPAILTDLADADESGTESAADVAFEGNGAQGRCMIGIERKKIKDMMKSIRTGRFSARQLPTMWKLYQHRFLVVEGMIRSDRDTGMLMERANGGWEPVEVGGMRFMYKELYNFCATMENVVGVKVKYTATVYDTVDEIINMYRWWNGKDWEEHASHLAMFVQPSPGIMLREPPLVRRVAKELPAIGWKMSIPVSRKFKTVLAMVNAEAREFEEIAGIGRKTAEKIWEAIRTIGVV